MFGRSLESIYCCGCDAKPNLCQSVEMENVRRRVGWAVNTASSGNDRVDKALSRSDGCCIIMGNINDRMGSDLRTPKFMLCFGS